MGEVYVSVVSHGSGGEKIGCIAHSISDLLKWNSSALEMQAVIMQLGFMAHWKKIWA